MAWSNEENLQRWAPVVITWIDIHCDYDAHDPDEFIENFEPCIRKTAGFFLGLDHGHVFLCDTDDRLAKVEFEAEQINSFPIQNVLSVMPFKSAD